MNTIRRGFFGSVAAAITAAVVGIRQSVASEPKAQKSRKIRLEAVPQEGSGADVFRRIFSRTGPLKLVLIRSEFIGLATIRRISDRLRSVDPGVVVLWIGPDDDYDISLYEEIS